MAALGRTAIGAGTTTAEERPNEDKNNKSNNEGANKHANFNSILSCHGDGLVSLAVSCIINELISF